MRSRSVLEALLHLQHPFRLRDEAEPRSSRTSHPGSRSRTSSWKRFRGKCSMAEHLRHVHDRRSGCSGSPRRSAPCLRGLSTRRYSANRPVGILHVMQRVLGVHEVERGVGERQLLAVRDHEVDARRSRAHWSRPPRRRRPPLRPADAAAARPRRHRSRRRAAARRRGTVAQLVDAAEPVTQLADRLRRLGEHQVGDVSLTRRG